MPRFRGLPQDEMNVRREIEAKECLLRKGAYFGIPPEESETTRGLLEKDYRELSRIRRIG